MALFPKKPSSPPSGIPSPGRTSPGGTNPPAGSSGGQGQWVRLGEHFDILKFFLEDPAHGLKWDNPAFKAYVAKISSKPLEFMLGPSEKVQAQVVQIVAGGRASMHGFRLLLKTAGRENLRRLSGTEGVASRHFPAEILKKAKLAAEARAKGLQPPGAAPKPAAAPPAARPAAPKPPAPPAGRKTAQTDLSDFGEFSQQPKGAPSAAPPSKGADLGGDLSELGPSPEEFQSYMNSGRSPGEELPSVEHKAAAPALAKPSADLGGDLSELGPSPEEFQTYMNSGRAPGEELPGAAPKPAPEAPAEAAEELSDVDMMELTEAADAAESAVTTPPPSPPADEFAASAGSEWLGGAPEIAESPPPPSPDLGEAPTVQALEEDSFAGLDAAGDAAGFQAAPATGALSGESPSPAEVPEDDPFAALGEPSPAAASEPAAAAEEPQAAGEDAFSALDEAAPPPPPPLNTAPVPLASSPPTEFLGDSPEAEEPQVPAAEAPAAPEAPPAEEEVIDAADEYLDSGAAPETPEPEGMMAEAERIAREVASEPAPEPPPPPMQEPPPTEPTMAVQYAHDDAQYLEGLSDEAPPSAPAEESITDAEDYMKESAGEPPVPAAGESRPRETAPLEASAPPGPEEKVESAADSAEAVPVGESTPLAPATEPARPEAPQASGESFVDITGDDDIRQALEDAGGIVMTPVDPSEMPSRPVGTLKPPPPAVTAPKPPPPVEPAPPSEALKPASVKWVPFTKESSDELKAAAKKVPVSERSADKLVFNLKLLVKFPPDGSEVTGRLCVYQKRPALLVDGETEPRVLTKECFFSYL